MVVLALAIGGLAWHASLSAPLGPAAGTALRGEEVVNSTVTEVGRRTLRVGTFNIHGCKGLDGRRDVDRVAGCLPRPLDILALNEVHGPRPWEKLDQAGQLAERAGMSWLFAPHSRTWYCLDSGNGLLSVLPVESWQRIPLERRTGRGYRNAVLANLQHNGRTIHVLLTHVARSDEQERQSQLRTVIELYESLAAPAILLGDLNTLADDPRLSRLLKLPGVRDAVGEALGAKTPPRIDWIITRGLRCLRAGVEENEASDHPLVWAEVEAEEG